MRPVLAAVTPIGIAALGGALAVFGGYDDSPGGTLLGLLLVLGAAGLRRTAWPRCTATPRLVLVLKARADSTLTSEPRCTTTSAACAVSMVAAAISAATTAAVQAAVPVPCICLFPCRRALSARSIEDSSGGHGFPFINRWLTDIVNAASHFSIGRTDRPLRARLSPPRR